MKKVFSLQHGNHARARVVEQIKGDVRRYVTRERRKPLPEGFSTWTMDCRVGASAADAQACTLEELGRAIDAVANRDVTGVYIELLAVPGHRPQRERGPSTR